MVRVTLRLGWGWVGLGWFGDKSYLKDEKFVDALDGNVPDLVMWPNGKE